MRYAQVKSGQRLHLVYEAGEGKDDQHLFKAGFISAPLCGRDASSGYIMTINVPLANACRNCLRVWRSRHSGEKVVAGE